MNSSARSDMSAWLEPGPVNNSKRAPGSGFERILPAPATTWRGTECGLAAGVGCLTYRDCRPRRAAHAEVGSLPTVKYVRLYTDENGHSRFEDLDLQFAARDFAPPAPPLHVSDPTDASAFMMLRAPAGWADSAHPSPARQIMVVLAGSWEVSAGGETRTFSVGDVVLTEDTSGPGHASTVLEDTVVAVVRLPT